MKHLKKLRSVISGAVLSVALVASSVAGVNVLAQPGNGQDKKADRVTPPSTSFSSGPQTKAPVEAGSVDAEETAKLGDTQKVEISADGQLKSQATISPMAGNVSGVDFATPINYCYKHLTYLPVTNTTSTSKYVQVVLYNSSTSTQSEKYVTVAANSTSYVAFYGVEGSYYGYLYVWNGSSYAYDEYKSDANNCSVSVTRTYNTGGWVQLKIENTGNAYVTQKSSELAPFPGSGTYTGTQYDYPTAGGTAIYRWFWVSTSPYGIISDTMNSTSNPWLFTGDL